MEWYEINGTTIGREQVEKIIEQIIKIFEKEKITYGIGEMILIQTKEKLENFKNNEIIEQSETSNETYKYIGLSFN